MTLIKSDFTSKMIAIIAFICIFISLVIIVITPSATIYEISIYTVYPWYFWFFIVTAIFLGQLIIFKDVFYNSSENTNKVWLLGLIAILITIIILLELPTIRGYATYGYGDHLYHIGEIKDILQFGNIGQDNFYPNLHILTASLILVTNRGILDIANFIPDFFFLLLPISIYLFMRIILNKKNEIKLALILASTLLFFGSTGNYLAPYYQSFLLIPIILYLYFKRGSIKNTASFSFLFIVVVLSYTFYHPINFLLLILILLFLAIIFYLYPEIKGIKLIELPEKNIREKSINIVLFSILLFVTWYFSFSYIVGSFYRVFSSIFGGTDESFFGSQLKSFISYSPKLLDTLRVIAYSYGLLLIIGILSIFSLVYTLIKWYKNKQTKDLRFCFVFSGITFLVFSVILAGAILSNLIVEWYRFLLWTTIFSIILITLAFFSLLSGFKNGNSFGKQIKKSIVTSAVCVIIISLTFLSIFTFYPTPMNGNANLQVTKMDWMGAEWINEHSDKKTLIDELGISQWRFYSAIYGVKEYPVNYKFRRAPDHFSYQNKTSLGEYYDNSRYIVITHLARIFYPEAYPDYKELWRFTPHDFDQLQNDNTVIRLYDNVGFETYLIKTIIS